MNEIERGDDLLRRTTVAVINQLMLPAGDITPEHMRRCIDIADAVEGLIGDDLSVPLAQALMDMKSARLDAARIIMGERGQRGDPERARRKFDAAV